MAIVWRHGLFQLNKKKSLIRNFLNRFIQYHNDREFILRGDFIIGIDVLSYLDAIFQWRENGEIDQSVFINRQGQDVFGRLINQETRYSLARGNHGKDPIAGLRGAKSIKKVHAHGVQPNPRGIDYGGDI